MFTYQLHKWFILEGRSFLLYYLFCTLWARCPSICSSIVIELNVPRVEFTSIVIELSFVTLGRGFKNDGSVLFDIGDAWDKNVLNPITSVNISITGWYYGCV